MRGNKPNKPSRKGSTFGHIAFQIKANKKVPAQLPTPTSPETPSPSFPSAAGHGYQCDCYQCTLKTIYHGVRNDENWLREHQSPNQLPYDFRVMSATAAMQREGLYLPNAFNANVWRQSGGARTSSKPSELFVEQEWTWKTFPGFTAWRSTLKCERPLGPRKEIRIPVIYTSGVCVHSGTSILGGKGACSFIVNSKDETSSSLSFPLEEEGPYGDRFTASSSRAELRAVIAALEWRFWYREGWEALVIATDSLYVGQAACKWAAKWAQKEWCFSDGSRVDNRDLWKDFLRLMRMYAIHGCEVMIWQISREQNEEAVTLAKEAAVEFPTPEPWMSYKDPTLKHDRYFNF